MTHLSDEQRGAAQQAVNVATGVVGVEEALAEAVAKKTRGRQSRRQ